MKGSTYENIKTKARRTVSKRANHSFPQLPPTLEQIRQRAHDIYVARGGAEGSALNDWLQAEQELKRKLEG